MDDKTSKAWNDHYTNKKSVLKIPDENLARILSKIPVKEGVALDFGAGSGRHSIYLKSLGFSVLACDESENAIDLIQKEYSNIRVLLCKKLPLPVDEGSIDLIVNWGVLHYNIPEIAQSLVADWARMLKSGGYLVGSVRSDRDTHLCADQDGKMTLRDLQGGYAKLYSDIELRQLLSDNFKNIKIGHTERTLLGDLESRICHWIFTAEKK